MMPQPDGSRTWRLVQAVYVIRGDAIAEYLIDYGPEEEFPNHTAMLIPSFGENSVAQLQELAERDRTSDRWAKYRQELKEASTMHADIFRQMQENSEQIACRSVFGPAVTVQRGGYSRERTARIIKERTHAR